MLTRSNSSSIEYLILVLINPDVRNNKYWTLKLVNQDQIWTYLYFIKLKLYLYWIMHVSLNKKRTNSKLCSFSSRFKVYAKICRYIINMLICQPNWLKLWWFVTNHQPLIFLPLPVLPGRRAVVIMLQYTSG